MKTIEVKVGTRAEILSYLNSKIKATQQGFSEVAEQFKDKAIKQKLRPSSIL